MDALDKHPIRREESLDQIHLDIVDVDEDALTKMVSEASREEIAVVINTLPLTQREALNLWMNDDLSFDEIGVIFEKLAIEKVRPKLFSDRLTWALSGFATLTVLFIAVTNYHTPIKRSFNHTEYISSAIEIQNSLNEDISGDDLDLTSLDYDEI